MKEKQLCSDNSHFLILIEKTLRIMKLTFVFLVISLLSFTAFASAQRISLAFDNVKVEKVLSAITKQTGLSVAYSKQIVNLDRTVSIHITDAEINEALDKLIAGTSLGYEVKNGKIYLFDKNKTEKTIVTQQRKKITGTVIDERGDPIIGANVVEKGTTNGTVTDLDGKFALNNVNENGSLDISYIGYVSQTISIKGKEYLTINLIEDSQKINEVVVTALGVNRQSKAIGYAIEKLDGSQLSIAGQTNMALGLAGKVSGVQVAASSSGMDGTPRVVIRGISSLSNDNSPLWVINGIPQQTNRVLNESLWAPQGFNDWGNPISDINPNDIESMTVLKGAAATALYGSRASNGAIIVTTKSGARNQKGWSVTLNQTTTFSRPLVLPKYQTLYGQGSNGEYEYVDGNGNGKGESGVAYGPSYIDPATGTYRKIPQYNSPIDPVTGKRIPTDFKPYPDNYENFFQTGLDANSTIAVSHMTDNSNTRISLSHNAVRDIVPNSKLKRISGTINTELKLGSRLKVDLMMLMSQMDSPNRSNMGSGGAMQSLIDLPPSVNILDFKGNYKDEFGQPRSWTTTTTNPYWGVYENLNPSSRNKFTGKIGFTLELIEGLNIQSNLYNDYNMTNHEQIVAVWKQNGGSYKTGSNLSKEYNADVALNYTKKISDFVFTGNISTAIRNEKSYYRSAWSEGGLITPGVYNLANSRLEAKTSFEQIEKEVQSVYGYLDFSYKDFIYLTLTGRNDWSSTLPKGQWSYFYPSVSASLILTELVKIDPMILSFAKLRGNWAKVGNDTAPYQLQRYVSRGSDWSSESGKQPVLGFENILPPTGLKPEEKKSWEIGADLRFLNHRIGVDVAYFHDISKNQIIKAETPWEGGARHRIVNAGVLKTTGWEVKVDASPIITKDFNWDISLNWSKNTTKVVELYPGVDFLHLSAFNGNEVRAMPGRRYGEIWGFMTVEDSQKFWDTYVNSEYPWLQEMVGDKKPYGTGKEFVKDGTVMHTYWNLAPLPLYTTPDWMAGMTNSFRYKDFDVSFTIDMRKGGYIASTSVLYSIFNGKDPMTTATNPNGVNIREPIANGGGLIYDGTDIDTGKPNTIAVDAQGFYDNWTTPTTKMAFKGDYIKLRELTVGYRVPQTVYSKLGISGMRVAFVGRNLWLIQSSLPGFDPETTGMGSGNSGVGVEFMSLPSTRNLGFNVQVEF